MSLAVEITVEDLAGLEIAARAGADRIELASDLDHGGITPGPALVEEAVSRSRALVGAHEARAHFGVHALIRPTASTGDFLGRPEEFAADPRLVERMAREAAAVVEAGAAGVVIGVLTEDGELDVPALTQIRDAALGAASRAMRGIDVTLHRAVDAMAGREQRVEATRLALTLGFARILTSGGAARALDGAEDLAAMVEAAEGVVEIMAGSGVRPVDIPDLARRARVDAVHTSARSRAQDPQAPALTRTDAAIAQAAVDAAGAL
ncbi:copper homeostasis protein CutC [Brachybacterium hainanense]|uniref:PF03932 family protein CutC n=1 Tax=Brachybacterium hainanense TaxID=1541174 RepID=A0ABV6RGF9_9MICO